jgi:prolyl oligopeptidase
MTFSNDNKYIAFTTNKAGSDWQKIFVFDVKSQKTLEDKIKKVKFSGPTWATDSKGFFYSSYFEKNLPHTESKDIETKALKNNKVYFHKLGDKQEDD